MEEKKYLNEKNYQKAERAITLLAILILVIGFSIGGFLIYKGVAKPGTSNVEDLKIQLETKKSELESKGVKFDEFAEYTDGEKYDLKIVRNALDPSFNHCAFDEYKSNSITKEYCAAKNKTGDFASSSSIAVGIFICFVTIIIMFPMLMFAKGRHILAFTTQQVMPVAKEGIDEMAPTIGNAAGEIAKGIKEGLKDEEK